MYYESAAIEEDLRCSFCKEKFQDEVKLIPGCGESICGRCYDELMSKVTTKSTRFKCQACHTEHSVPRSGFPDNKGFSRMLKRRKVEKALTDQAKELKASIDSIKQELGGLESFDAVSHVNKTCDELMTQVCQAVENEIKSLRDLEENLLKQIKEYRTKCLDHVSDIPAKKSNPASAAVKAFSRKIADLSQTWSDFFVRADVTRSDKEIEVALDLVKEYKKQLQPLAEQLKISAFNGQAMSFQALPFNRDRFKLQIIDKAKEIAESTPLLTLAGHSGGIFCTSFLPGGRLVSCSRDSKIKVWDMKSGKELSELKGHDKWVFSLVVLANGWLASCSTDGTIKIWNLNGKKLLKTLVGHTKSVIGLKLLKSGKLVSYSTDNTIKVWDPYIDTNNLLITMKGHENISKFIQFGVLSNDLIVTCTMKAENNRESSLNVWSPASGKILSNLPTGSKNVECLLVLVGDRIALGFEDGDIMIISPFMNAKTRQRERAHKWGVTALAQFSNGNLVSSGGESTCGAPFAVSIKIWDINDFGLLRVITTGHSDVIDSLSISPDERSLASGSRDSTIKFWLIA